MASNYGNRMSILLLCLLSLAAVLPKSNAGIAEFDDYLKKKAAASHEEYVNAYEPDPEMVAEQISQEVGK